MIGPDAAPAGSGSGVRWSKLLPPPADAMAPRELPLNLRLRRLRRVRRAGSGRWPRLRSCISSGRWSCRPRSGFAGVPRCRLCRPSSDIRRRSRPAAARARRCATRCGPATRRLLSLKRSLVAMVSLATGVPCGVYFDFGILAQIADQLNPVQTFACHVGAPLQGFSIPEWNDGGDREVYTCRKSAGITDTRAE